jgi:hypothetical protein
MPPGSRTPPQIRPQRNRLKWRRRLASIRRRQWIAQIIAIQDPKRAARTERLRKERRALKAKARRERAKPNHR